MSSFVLKGPFLPIWKLPNWVFAEKAWCATAFPAHFGDCFWWTKLFQYIKWKNCSELIFYLSYFIKVIFRCHSKYWLFWASGLRFIHSVIGTHKFKLLFRTKSLKYHYIQIIHQKCSPIHPVECCSAATVNWDSSMSHAAPWECVQIWPYLVLIARSHCDAWQGTV